MCTETLQHNYYVLADLLTWIFKQQRVHIVHHYLDNFLTLGPPASIKPSIHTAQKPTTRHTSGYGKSRRAFYTVVLPRDNIGQCAYGSTPTS